MGIYWIKKREGGWGGSYCIRDPNTWAPIDFGAVLDGRAEGVEDPEYVVEPREMVRGKNGVTWANACARQAGRLTGKDVPGRAPLL